MGKPIGTRAHTSRVVSETYRLNQATRLLSQPKTPFALSRLNLSERRYSFANDMFAPILSLLSSIRQGFRSRSCAPDGDSCSSASGLSPSAGQPGSTAPADRLRQTPLSLALTTVERVAICSGDRQARNRGCLAPTRVSVVLELEEPPSTRPTIHLA